MTPQTVASQAPSVHGISQARILKQVAVSYFRGSSQARDQTHIVCVSYIDRQIFFTTEPPGKPHYYYIGMCYVVQNSNVLLFKPIDPEEENVLIGIEPVFAKQ